MTAKRMYEFFEKLSEKERKELPFAIRRLLKNKDFKLFVRDMFLKAPPLQPDFLSREQFNVTAAAVRSGEKNVSRALLKMILDAEAPYEPQPEQKIGVIEAVQQADFTAL